MLHPTLDVDEAAVTHTQTQMTKVQLNWILCVCGECPPPGNRSPRHRGTPEDIISCTHWVAADWHKHTQTSSWVTQQDDRRHTVGLYLARQDTPVGSLLPIVQPVNLGAGNSWPACHSVCINICGPVIQVFIICERVPCIQMCVYIQNTQSTFIYKLSDVWTFICNNNKQYHPTFPHPLWPTHAHINTGG